ncbi:MAG: D-alanine--D-alanine ligase [Turneriella sp.]|nr:D-alanine--D-alanine ligase [Turneriella sp.]
MVNIALIYGGQSGEHEVSCVSAAYLEKSLQEAGFRVVPLYIDYAGHWHLQQAVHQKPKDNKKFPVALVRRGDAVLLEGMDTTMPVNFAFSIVHGTTGEDGRLQGFFETLSLPYAGSGVATSAICMDKSLMRALFARAGLDQTEYFEIAPADTEPAEIDTAIRQRFGYPVFIKPCNAGSSVGVQKVHDAAGLAAALVQAAQYDNYLLCEKALSVRELEVAILGNFPEYTTSGVGEIRVNHEFYSYEAKYLDPHGAELLLRAEISAETEAEIQKLARKAFAAVHGDGFARVDFFLEKTSGKILINEINTLPGFTPISMFPQLFAAAGYSGAELVRRIVELGFERWQRSQKLRRAFR